MARSSSSSRRSSGASASSAVWVAASPGGRARRYDWGGRGRSCASGCRMASASAKRPASTSIRATARSATSGANNGAGSAAGSAAGSSTGSAAASVVALQAGAASRRHAATARTRQSGVRIIVFLELQKREEKEGGTICATLPVNSTGRGQGLMRETRTRRSTYYFVAANAPETRATSPPPIAASNSPVAAIGWLVSASVP